MKSDQEIRKSVRAAIDDCTRGIDEAPSLRFRIARKVKGEEPVKKRISFRIICVIAALLLGTMTALAAGVEEVNATLYKLWPEAARTLRPLNLSTEQDGIRLDVISATLNDEYYLVTYSLTDTKGDRINENSDCCATLGIPLSERIGWNKLLNYDPEKHQAVYGAYFEYKPLSGNPEPVNTDTLNVTLSAPENLVDGSVYFEYTPFSGDSGLRDSDTITFTVNGLENPVKTALDLRPLMDGRDYTAEAVPAPSELFLVDTEIPGEEAVVPNILNPAANLHIPLLDDAELSGIGWVDGSMHVQLHISDYMIEQEKEDICNYYARYSSHITLRDKEGKEVMDDADFAAEHLRDKPGFVREIQWGEGSDLWIERIFPIGPDETASYSIDAEITDLRAGVEDLLKNDWTVSFPANMIRAEE